MSVYQEGLPHTPSFDLRPLTAEFLSNAIHSAPAFAFSIRSSRIGDVAYVSGAAARDCGEVRQGMVSLDATGTWKQEGLAIRLTGDLGDRTVSHDRPVLPGYRKDRFEIEVEIPWMILRFLFFEQKGFVIDNYKRYCCGSL